MTLSWNMAGRWAGRFDFGPAWRVRRVGCVVIALAFLWGVGDVRAETSVARVWSEEILAAIRIDRPNPPVHARNLFHVAAGMYDAWAAYDGTAVGYVHHERAAGAGDVAASRREAISYAAYRILRHRFANSANAAVTAAALDARMTALGYDFRMTSTFGGTPAAMGNRIATSILGWGQADGSNEAGGYVDFLYVNPQRPLVVLMGGVPQGGMLAPGIDPNRWQPLAFDVAFTQNGLEADKVQTFAGVTWLQTVPFALERTDPQRPWIDPGGPSKFGPATARYQAGAMEVLRRSSRLNSSKVIDISPGLGGVGNNPLGSDAGAGHAVNPSTGQPYASNLVAEGDFARVLAEFWADGPHSETPPGHWQVLANEISDHPATVKRIGGRGEKVDDLEWDVKLSFALSAATHDAACAAWSLKRYYEGVRPITMIRHLGAFGQSSDPGGPSYHPDGLPLEPGVVEVITAATAAPGGRHYGVGWPGEIAVFSWPGEPAIPASQTSPVRWMRAVDWLPYQRKTFNTPAFPGYISGHSTFSRAAAEVLTAFTGSAFFPGGLGRFEADANTYLVFERGPSSSVTLQWATYYDAADQAGMSRIWGGIHVPEDDFDGRRVGAQVGQTAWSMAQRYFDGSVAAAAPEVTFSWGGRDQIELKWTAVRGLKYTVQACPELGSEWVTVARLPAAMDTNGRWSGPRPASSKGFYRLVQTTAP